MFAFREFSFGPDMIRQQGAVPRRGFELHDLALCRPSLASSCELCRALRGHAEVLLDLLDHWPAALVEVELVPGKDREG